MNILVEKMSQLIKLSEEERLAIEQSFAIKTFNKGTYLLQAGQVARDAFFVIEGCIRKYSILNGEEVTADFYIEGDSVADLNSLANQTPSKYCFVCSEKTEVAVVNAEKEATLYKRFPRFETVCRIEFEKLMGQKADSVAAFVSKNREEKYLSLLKEKPGLLNRVPHYQIASYLGMKPETLSRIRKRISVK